MKKNFEEDARGEAEPWQCLVRQVLVHIYGKSLGNYCCNGRKGSRPGLDKTLRKDLLGELNSILSERMGCLCNLYLNDWYLSTNFDLL